MRSRNRNNDTGKLRYKVHFDFQVVLYIELYLISNHKTFSTIGLQIFHFVVICLRIVILEIKSNYKCEPTCFKYNLKHIVFLAYQETFSRG